MSRQTDDPNTVRIQPSPHAPTTTESDTAQTPDGLKHVHFENVPSLPNTPAMKLRSPPPPAIPWQSPHKSSPSISPSPGLESDHESSAQVNANTEEKGARFAPSFRRRSVQFGNIPSDIDNTNNEDDDFFNSPSIRRKPTPHPREMRRSIERHQDVSQKQPVPQCTGNEERQSDAGQNKHRSNNNENSQ